MERLIELGKVKAKSALDITSSRLGIGFEKLDRKMFDPEKAYDKLGALGVKWVRIQSGWARTEKRRGIYDFAWLDDIVENLLQRGLVPWICLCYGNGLYDEAAAENFGAVGCPPVRSREAAQAWSIYVTALTAHMRGRVSYYEVWNEPDGVWCWKHGPSGNEYGKFVVDTAAAVRKGDSGAKVIGGAVCRGETLDFLYDAFAVGMGHCLDAISYHQYTVDERQTFRRVDALHGICDAFGAKLELIQGESGAPSRSDGHGAMNTGAWTPRRQAKQLARHLMVDLMTDIKFTSYFSCMDMVEALNGTVGDVGSYQDYGYFGVLGAEFDTEGYSVGAYTPKPSYYALQTIAALFWGDVHTTAVPVIRVPEHSKRLFAMDCDDATIVSSAFGRSGEDSAAYVYWNSTPLLTTEFESTISLNAAALPQPVRLVDLLDGKVYELPEEMVEKCGEGKYHIHNLPIRDYPLVLSFGEFVRDEEIE